MGTTAPMSIFISIVAYRDPWLWRTVNDALAHATAPDQLVFGIVEQAPQSAAPPALLDSRKVRLIQLHHRFSRGPCWARALALSLLADEPFVLQIDSHTIFDQGWDTRLLETLAALRNDHPKALLTTYPGGFQQGPDGVVKTRFEGQALVLRPRKDAAMTAQDPAFYFEAVGVATRHPVPGCHVAGGFIFAPAALFREVPYDPVVYFLGEEQSLAARAWTRGWDIFHMPDAPLYHLYHASGEAPRPLHWDAQEDEERPQKWWQLQEASRARLRALFYEGEDLGAFGLGQQRSLREFAEFCGIDYAHRTLDAQRRPGGGTW